MALPQVDVFHCRQGSSLLQPKGILLGVQHSQALQVVPQWGQVQPVVPVLGNEEGEGRQGGGQAGCGRNT